MNLKEQFLVKLQERAIPFELNGSMTDATGHIVNLYFPFVEVETMLTLLDMAQIYVSWICMYSRLYTTVACFRCNVRRWSDQIIQFDLGLTELTTRNEINAIVAEIHKIYLRIQGGVIILIWIRVVVGMSGGVDSSVTAHV